MYNRKTRYIVIATYDDQYEVSLEIEAENEEEALAIAEKMNRQGVPVGTRGAACSIWDKAEYGGGRTRTEYELLPDGFTTPDWSWEELNPTNQS